MQYTDFFDTYIQFYRFINYNYLLLKQKNVFLTAYKTCKSVHTNDRLCRVLGNFVHYLFFI